MMEIIPRHVNIPFVKIRGYGFVVSAVLLLLGLFALVQIMRGEAKMGVDFAGGTSAEVEFVRDVSSEELRDALKDEAFRDVSQQAIREPGRHKYMLRIFAPSLPTERVSSKVIEVLQTNLPDAGVTLLSSEDVGPSVSAHLREQAFMAIFWAMVGILIYVWWRFDFRFSVAATVTTVHDILAVLGLLFLLGQEVNLLMVTALLTIGGYSLNDTVVVFDRIRENLRLSRKEPYDGLVNRSVNEILSRTLITSFSTLLVVGCLYALGGEVIHAFALAMLIGIAVGTFSSIFTASNLMVEWHARAPLPR